MTQATLIYEKDTNTGCEFWKERSTGRVFRFRHGKYQKLYDSKGNITNIEDDCRSAKFRYNDENKICSEYHVFIDPDTKEKTEYIRWYRYDEHGKILSITDSCGNKEYFDINGMPLYFISGKQLTYTLLT